MTEPLPWLVTFVPYPSLTDLRAKNAADPNYRDVLDCWEQHTGPLRTAPARVHEMQARMEVGDDQDALEQAYRLWAAVQAKPAGQLWLRNIAGTKEHVNAATGEAIDASASGFLRWGVQSQDDWNLPGNEQDAMANGYASTVWFRRHAGRDFALCGDDLYDVAARMGGRLFIKVNRAKLGVHAFDLPPGATAEDASRILLEQADEDFGWQLVRFDGVPGSFLVQRWTPMRYEYRVFVVDGHPVTGAGCIEEHTPADNTGDAFDPVVRENRDVPGEPPIVAPAIRDLLIAYAHDVAADIREETPQLRDYVVDVALGPDGVPLVIELNGITNAGLYANQPARITDALAPRTELPEPRAVPSSLRYTC